MTEQPKAAIYVRVSSAQQEDGFSLDTQEARCRAHAADNGYAVATVYREVFTGVELWERPQLTTLREAVRQHEIAAVITYSIDRLARDPVHLGVVLSEAEHAGVPVLFVSEPLDDSPEGQLIRFVRGYAAKVEHEKMRERVLRGRRARAEAGKLIVGRRALYGYRWRDAGKGALDPDPLTAPIVQRLFRDVAAGTSMRQLAETLTREGIPTPTGGATWNRTTIQGILDHPYYRGDASAYRHRYVKQAGRLVKTMEGDAIPLPAGTVPALVDAALWQATQEVRTRNQREASRRNAHPEAFLLRGGYAVCAGCGQPMHADARATCSRYVCFRKYGPQPTCEATLSIDAPTLDREVWAEISGLLNDPEIVRREVAKLRSDDPAAADIAGVERALADVDRKRANLARAIAQVDDPDFAGPLTAELGSLGAQRRRLEEEREAVSARRQRWADAQTRLDDLEHWLHGWKANLAAADYAHKRLTLAALGVRVEVFPKAWKRPAPWRLQVELPLVSESTTGFCTKLPT